jgi:UDP-N-acetylmuramoyl-L-alanyl-D-glutamate--2,6-diaminopimelate ligase
MPLPARPAALLPPPPPWSQRLSTVGITGTNGKTTTTTFVAAALSRLARPVARVTTLGAYLDDTPLDLPPTHDGFIEAMRRALAAGGRLAAIELTSEALALGFAKAWPCRIGIFTNLTRDHMDAHGTPEHYLASKAQLFVHLPRGGAAILNACDPASALLAEVVPSGVQIVRYGVPSRAADRGAMPAADLAAERVAVGWEGTRIDLARSSVHPDLPGSIAIRAIGEHFAENALAALLGAICAGVPAALAARAIAEVPPLPGRFEVIGRGPRAVVDYGHSPDALARTLRTARGLCRGRLTVVFGAGGDRDRGKRAPMGEAARVADRIVLTSDNPRREDPAAIARQIREGTGDHPDVLEILDREAAIGAALADAGPEDVVVIAGRGPETEQIFAGGQRRLVDAEVARAALGAR